MRKASIATGKLCKYDPNLWFSWRFCCYRHKCDLQALSSTVQVWSNPSLVNTTWTQDLWYLLEVNRSTKDRTARELNLVRKGQQQQQHNHHQQQQRKRREKQHKNTLKQHDKNEMSGSDLLFHSLADRRDAIQHILNCQANVVNLL